MNDKVKQPKPDDKSANSPKRKHVGDETPNPLPDDQYSIDQPAGDDSQANPDTDSAIGN